MSTWYEAKEYTWKPEIRPVEVERETESSVYIRGQRRAKSSAYSSYYPTWELAHQHLLAWSQGRVETARLELERANSVHGNVKGMQKPADA